MPISFTDHANRRLKQSRQRGVTRREIERFLRSIPGKLAAPIKFTFYVRAIKCMVVAVDRAGYRLVITVIGVSE